MPKKKYPFALFLEKNTARDEYVEEAAGFFVKGRCLIGVIYRPGHGERSAGQAVGLVVGNQAVGVWRDPGEKGE